MQYVCPAALSPYQLPSVSVSLHNFEAFLLKGGLELTKKSSLWYVRHIVCADDTRTLLRLRCPGTMDMRSRLSKIVDSRNQENDKLVVYH